MKVILSYRTALRKPSRQAGAVFPPLPPTHPDHSPWKLDNYIGLIVPPVMRLEWHKPQRKNPKIAVLRTSLMLTTSRRRNGSDGWRQALVGPGMEDSALGRSVGIPWKPVELTRQREPRGGLVVLSQTTHGIWIYRVQIKNWPNMEFLSVCVREVSLWVSHGDVNITHKGVCSLTHRSTEEPTSHRQPKLLSYPKMPLFNPKIRLALRHFS